MLDATMSRARHGRGVLDHSPLLSASAVHAITGALGMQKDSADVPGLIFVIVTTYDREDALDAVLAALSRQRDRGFEVVIADDGSGPGTAAIVAKWRARIGVPLGLRLQGRARRLPDRGRARGHRMGVLDQAGAERALEAE